LRVKHCLIVGGEQTHFWGTAIIKRTKRSINDIRGDDIEMNIHMKLAIDIGEPGKSLQTS